MEDGNKSKKELVRELAELRRRVAELERLNRGRVLTEQALKESEEKYRSIIDNIEEGYYEVDLGGSFTFFNDRVCRILGYDRSELLGMNFRKFQSKEAAQRSFQAFNKVYRTGESDRMFDYEVIRSDGAKRHLEVSITLIPGAKEGESVFRGMIRDATDRKKAEEALRIAHIGLEKRVEERTKELVRANEALKREIAERKQVELALRESEARYRNTIESIDDGYYEIDDAGNVIFCNEALCRIVGHDCSDLVGLNYRRLMNEKSAKLVSEVFDSVRETGKPAGMFGWELKRMDGSFRSVECSVSLMRNAVGDPVGFRGLIIDVTERKRAQEELAGIQKLESIGVLAGGIAHDFNNILTAIQGNISLARLFAKPGSKVIKRLDAAERASVRARDLTRQLLTFSKGGTPIKAQASVGNLVRESCRFALRGSNVKCEFRIPPDTWTVEVDKVQIGQAIGNIATNADQAMPAGGVILVSAENLRIEGDEGISLDRGDYVRICIEDRGVGMDEETLHKVFDPYFTSKPAAGGLGLTTAFSIVKNHDGLISLESRPGVGTKVNIYLPAMKVPAEEPVALSSAEETVPGGGRILVMDDEEPIRELAKELLVMLGFEVETARDGLEAIKLFSEAKQSSRRFDAVILDLTVPGGMGGKETMERLVRIDPDVGAIVSSGYSNDPIMANFREYGFSGVIPKPYNAAQISEALRQVISRGE
jgi:PAS domain S-box-containing protein